MMFCVFSLILDIKHIKQNFHSVAWMMHKGWDLGVLGVKIFENKLSFAKFGGRFHATFALK